MGKNKKIIFDSAALINDGEPVVFSALFSSRGSTGRHYELKYYYLNIVFQAGGIKIKRRFELASDTEACKGGLKPYKENIFWKMEKLNELSLEKIETEISTFLLDAYEKGEVRKDSLIKKIEELIEKEPGRKKVEEED